MLRRHLYVRRYFMSTNPVEERRYTSTHKTSPPDIPGRGPVMSFNLDGSRVPQIACPKCGLQSILEELSEEALAFHRGVAK